MEKAKLLLQIVNRLAELELHREIIINDTEFINQVDLELTALRLVYQQVMNSTCPLLKEGN